MPVGHVINLHNVCDHITDGVLDIDVYMEEEFEGTYVGFFM